MADVFDSYTMAQAWDEMFAAPAHHFNLDRREFFKMFGGGIVVGFMLKDALGAQDSGGPFGGEGVEDAVVEDTGGVHDGT